MSFNAAFDDVNNIRYTMPDSMSLREVSIRLDRSAAYVASIRNNSPKLFRYIEDSYTGTRLAKWRAHVQAQETLLNGLKRYYYKASERRMVAKLIRYCWLNGAFESITGSSFFWYRGLHKYDLSSIQAFKNAKHILEVVDETCIDSW